MHSGNPLSHDRRIAAWQWIWPLLVAALTLPIWQDWWEPGLMIALNRGFSHLPDELWALLSLLGTGWAVYALTVPALWRMPRLMLAWICAAPLASLATHAGKALADSPRPLKVLGPDVLHTIGTPLYHWAMPSGHTLTAFATAAAIYFSLRREGRLRWAWLFLLAFGVGCSRIAFAAHWPADVAMGMALGLLCGMSGAWLAARIPSRYLREQAWLMRIIALLGLPVLYVLCSGAIDARMNRPWQYLFGALMAASLLYFIRKTLRTCVDPAVTSASATAATLPSPSVLGNSRP